jgi:hypothetical protein
LRELLKCVKPDLKIKMKPEILNNTNKRSNVNGNGLGIGSLGANVINSQGNIELTKKNNLKKKVVARSSSVENKENRMIGTKQLRFVDSAMTLTPPPKDFKRMGSDRRTLRTVRCLSTVVTDRDRMEADRMTSGSPSKPPTGIVKSMCRIYSEGAGFKNAGKSIRLNRSSSFSAAVDKSVDSRLTVDTSSSTDSSPGEAAAKTTKKGLFKSWSLRRSKKEQQSPPPPSTSDAASQPKRCSPSCSSTKSADSGFSDSGESSNNGAVSKRLTVTSKVVDVDIDNSPEKQSTESVISQKSNQIQTNTSSTKIQTNTSSTKIQTNTSSTKIQTNTSSTKIQASLGNISSLQEGLRMKREQCEEKSVLDGGRVMMMNKSASNLLKANDSTEEDNDKARKQFYFSEIRRRYQDEERSKRRMIVESAADVSQLSEFGVEDGVPVFSTPVRASFRSRRPRTSIEGARTPSKVESRLRLREMKSRSQERNRNGGNKRWSNLELEAERSTCNESSINFNDRSDVPSGIEPSLVAVWSQGRI